MKSGKKKPDEHLFREAMAGVRPLRAPERIEPPPPRAAAVAWTASPVTGVVFGMQWQMPPPHDAHLAKMLDEIMAANP